MKNRSFNFFIALLFIVNILFASDKNKDIDKLKNLLKDKCNIKSSAFMTYFDTKTSFYQADINCSSANFKDKDLEIFKVLKGINGSLNLSNNNISSINGLKNLTVVKNLYLYNNHLVNDLNKLKNIKRKYLYIYTRKEHTLTPIYLTTNPTFQKKPVDEATIKPIETHFLSLSNNHSKYYGIKSYNEKDSVPISLTILHKNKIKRIISKNEKLADLSIKVSKLAINDKIIIKARGVTIFQTIVKE